jgi:glycosyltransferase involved in cell wall biosynthesis
MSNNKKVLLVCKTLPPLVIGSTILLKNLFDTYPGRIEAVAGWEYGAKEDLKFNLPFKTHYLKFKLPLFQRFLDRYRFFYFYLIRFFVLVKIRTIKPDAIFIACTPDGLFFTAAYLVAKRYKIPYYTHMHDLWLENTKVGSFSRLLANKYEREILLNAKKNFGMTLNQIIFFKKKYNDVIFDELPHCVAPSLNNKMNIEIKTTSAESEKLILYTGNISHAMNIDALRQFVKSIDLLPSNYKIKFLIGISKEECIKEGIYHNRISYDWVSVEESRRIINIADVLFLPLSFKNCSMNEVKTVFATKTLDYYLANAPILVFSPPESFHTIDALEKGWGYVVDKDSISNLADAIIELSNNSLLREKVIENSRIEATRRESISFSKKLFDIIESE